MVVGKLHPGRLHSIHAHSKLQTETVGLLFVGKYHNPNHNPIIILYQHTNIQ